MQNKRVAVYRMPNEQDFYSLISDKPLDIDSLSNNSNFFFSNFENNTTYSFSSPEKTTNKWPDFHPCLTKTQAEIKEEDYRKKITEITKHIRSNTYKKIVFSRVKNIEKQPDFELQTTFFSLCKKYPNAFVYCISSPETGTWMGATPEILVNQIGNKLSTVSLAGTRVEPIQWTDKEKLEQQVVTDYISEKLIPFSQKLTVSKPYDINTGSVIHLKSDIDIELTPNYSIWDVANSLHPTPAVCGIPAEKAKSFIEKNESHQRGLYTGYIGPVGINSHSTLFVNLRCMQIGEKKISLYLGGGIMGDSDPHKEWIETENKAKTLLSVLKH